MRRRRSAFQHGSSNAAADEKKATSSPGDMLNADMLPGRPVSVADNRTQQPKGPLGLRMTQIQILSRVHSCLN